MKRLDTQQDGRILAADTLALLRDAGPEDCRITARPDRNSCQADPLIMALLTLKERGTCDACIGFAAVLTDAIGTRGLEPIPELYDAIEREGRMRPYRLRRIVKRLTGGGLYLAAVALQREGLTAGEREPGGVTPRPASTPQGSSLAAPDHQPTTTIDRLSADPLES